MAVMVTAQGFLAERRGLPRGDALRRKRTVQVIRGERESSTQCEPIRQYSLTDRPAIKPTVPPRRSASLVSNCRPARANSSQCARLVVTSSGSAWIPSRISAYRTHALRSAGGCAPPLASSPGETASPPVPPRAPSLVQGEHMALVSIRGRGATVLLSGRAHSPASCPAPVTPGPTWNLRRLRNRTCRFD